MTGSTDDKISFSVVSTDGRKYNVFLKASDIPKLRVEKIKKTLVKVTGLPAGTFELASDGHILPDNVLGSQFDLREGSQLLLIPKDSAGNLFSASTAPTAGVPQSAPTYPTASVSTPPAAAARASPAPAELGRGTPGATAAMDALYRNVGMHNAPSFGLGAASSDRATAGTPTATAVPAGQSPRVGGGWVPTSTDFAAFAGSLQFFPTGYTQQQQPPPVATERLPLPASVPISRPPPTTTTAPYSPPPQPVPSQPQGKSPLPGRRSASPFDVTGHSNAEASPSAPTASGYPPLSEALFPASFNALFPAQGTQGGGAAQNAQSQLAAQHAAQLAFLNAQNVPTPEQRNGSPTPRSAAGSRSPAARGSGPSGSPSLLSGAPVTLAESGLALGTTEYAAPPFGRATTTPTGGRTASPTASHRDKDPLGAPQNATPASTEAERQMLRQKCVELEEQKRRLEREFDGFRASFDQEKMQFLKQWEEDQHRWCNKQQELIRDWEREKRQMIELHQKEKERLLKQQGVAPNEGTPAERREWALEREQIMRKWKEETDILTTIWTEDREEWFREKMHLLSAFDEQRNVFIRENQEGINTLTSTLQAAEDRARTLTNEVDLLRRDLERSRKETDQNKMFVLSAYHALDDLKTRIATCVGGDSKELAHLLVTAVTEKNLEKQKADLLSRENAALAQKYKQELNLRKHLHNTLEDMKGSVRVITRVRPYVPGEAVGGQGYDEGHVEVSDGMTVTVTTATGGPKPFDFFRALGMDAQQEDVFEEVRPMLQSTLDGFNVTVMAYGQTGSGKTYTILGETSGSTNRLALGDLKTRGVIPRAIQELFTLLGSQSPETTFSLNCSMVELYLDNLHDLLSPNNKRCELRQYPAGMLVVGSSQHTIRSPADAMMLLEQGAGQRQVHSTNVNAHSSRSHTIYTIQLTIDHGTSCTSSKLVFVDLAGSERISKSHSTGDRLKEAQHINRSLSCLGDVIAALSQRKGSFVPYRNSKLTMLLQESLGGNSKTVLFANICPSGANISETLSTLSFASRVRHVRNPFLKNITRAQNCALDAVQVAAAKFQAVTPRSKFAPPEVSLATAAASFPPVPAGISAPHNLDELIKRFGDSHAHQAQLQSYLHGADQQPHHLHHQQSR